MSPLRARVVLPMAQGALAILLLFVAHNQGRLVQLQRGAGESSPESLGFIPRTIWDYNEPALEVSAGLNFPVIAVLAPALALRPPIPVAQLLYVIGVILFWHWVGLKVEERYQRRGALGAGPRGPFLRICPGLAAVASAACGVLALTYVLGGLFLHLRLLCTAVLVWCAVFATYFGRRAVAVPRGASGKAVRA